MENERVQNFVDSFLYDLFKLVVRNIMFLSHVLWHKKITIVLDGKTIVIFILVLVLFVLVQVVILLKKDYSK